MRTILKYKKRVLKILKRKIALNKSLKVAVFCTFISMCKTGLSARMSNLQNLIIFLVQMTMKSFCRKNIYHRRLNSAALNYRHFLRCIDWIQFGLVWLVWLGLVGLVWCRWIGFSLVWLGLVGLVWFRWICFGLIEFGLVQIGLVWLNLICLSLFFDVGFVGNGLVWFSLVQLGFVGFVSGLVGFDGFDFFQFSFLMLGLVWLNSACLVVLYRID